MSFKIFGVNQFAVRFPTALAVILLIFFSYLFGHWAFNEKAGIYTAVILSTSVGTFLFTRYMIPETWLTLMKFAPVLSSKTLATAIMQNWQPGATIVFNGEYQKGSSIAFYTNQQILLLNGKVTGLLWGSKYPDVPPVFIDEAEFSACGIALSAFSSSPKMIKKISC